MKGRAQSVQVSPRTYASDRQTDERTDIILLCIIDNDKLTENIFINDA